MPYSNLRNVKYFGADLKYSELSAKSFVMKKIITFFAVALALVNSSAIAQVFTTAHDTIFINANSLSASYHDNITIPGTSAVSIKWQIDTANSDFPDDWITNTGGGSTAFCDNSGCYPSSIITSGIQLTASYTDTTPDFHMNICLLGATSRYETYVVTNALGVSNINTNDDISIFPNPAGSQVNVSFNVGLGISRMALYSPLGALISDRAVSGNTVLVNTEGLAQGVYFVRLLSNTGEVIAARRFLKN
jgi:Secretion system C-terminal sorting domain